MRRILTLTTLLPLLAHAAGAAAEAKPNILFILADDLGWSDVDRSGGFPAAETKQHYAARTLFNTARQLSPH